ncbi:MAG: 16S rRNA (guanine(527)-N(7))-methyltransferase RsmG [Pirellulales bacterium]
MDDENLSQPDAASPETADKPPAAPPQPDEYPNDTMAAALARRQITLPPDQLAQLEAYCALLWEWNEKLNLTRHTTFEKFVARDVVDSLALVPHIQLGDRVIDIGTGGGVPGVILKIVRPDLQMVLTDTVGKKVKAVDDIVRRIPLDVQVHHGRAEDMLSTRKAQTLVCRAVAPLEKLCSWFQPLRHAFDRMLVIKGPSWVGERYEARQKHLLDPWQLRKLEEWPLPGTESQSVLLELKRKESR